MAERDKIVNIFPSTLGPHGSNFGEIIEYLHQLREFDKGLQIQLKQLTKVCAFPRRDAGRYRNRRKKIGEVDGIIIGDRQLRRFLFFSFCVDLRPGVEMHRL